jgi:hypothetical protein
VRLNSRSSASYPAYMTIQISPSAACCRGVRSSNVGPALYPSRADGTRMIPCARTRGCFAAPKASKCVYTSTPRFIALSSAQLLLLASSSPALADDLVTYNASNQSEFITNLSGVIYVGLVAYLAYKVLTRRAKKFTSEVRLPPLHSRLRQYSTLLLRAKNNDP